MSLEGKIKDFGIADILQLLAQQQKTGILLVEQPGQAFEICFLNGAVTEARSNRQTARLGEMFVKAGLVSPEQVKTALDRQRVTFDYLGQILIREGLVRKEVVDQALLTQLYETFYDILQWREGDYRFIAEKVRADNAIENMPGLESILLDVLRMIDEWPDIKQIITSFDLIFGKVDGHNADDIEIDEMPVYQLIDGKRTVADVVDGSLLGRFGACKIMVELLQDGIIEVVARKAARAQKEGGGLVELVFGPGAYVLLAAVVLLSCLLPTGFPGSVLPVALGKYRHQSHVADYFRSQERQKIEYALQTWFVQTGRYPDSLAELVDEGLLPADRVSGLFSYSSTAEDYRLQQSEQ